MFYGLVVALQNLLLERAQVLFPKYFGATRWGTVHCEEAKKPVQKNARGRGLRGQKKALATF